MCHLSNPWLYFCIAFGIMLLATLLMGTQGKYLYARNPSKRKFSILEMEFPARNYDLARLINGIYELEATAKRAITTLYLQLVIDSLLFIPATYGGIYILCTEVAGKFPGTCIGVLFTGLAYGQFLCAALDYIENIYFFLLIRSHPVAEPTTNTSFRLLQLLEGFKWGIALIGGVGSLSAMFYFWLSGNYSQDTLCYVPIFVIEIGIFIILSAITGRKPKPKPANKIDPVINEKPSNSI